MTSSSKSSENAAQSAPKTSAKRVTGLGRGLNSLFGDIQKEEPLAGSDGNEATRSGNASLAGEEITGLRSIAISNIRPNPDQPRQYFDTAALDELADSMKQRGVVQPIVVRPYGKNFQIVAGERRWRAAQRARLHEVPAIVRSLSDAETLEIAIVENVQRKDLNAIEEAEAYTKLCEDYGHSQNHLSELVGKSRSHVANIMRLLDLPASVRKLVAEDKLQMGHARALINAPDASELAKRVAKDGLSVRETEKQVRKALGRTSPPAKPRTASTGAVDADIKAVETHLSDLLGLNVSIKSDSKDGGGSMTISYGNLDQLDLICQRLTGEHI